MIKESKIKVTTEMRQHVINIMYKYQDIITNEIGKVQQEHLKPENIPLEILHAYNRYKDTFIELNETILKHPEYKKKYIYFSSYNSSYTEAEAPQPTLNALSFFIINAKDVINEKVMKLRVKSKELSELQSESLAKLSMAQQYADLDKIIDDMTAKAEKIIKNIE